MLLFHIEATNLGGAMGIATFDGRANFPGFHSNVKLGSVGDLSFLVLPGTSHDDERKLDLSFSDSTGPKIKLLDKDGKPTFSAP